MESRLGFLDYADQQDGCHAGEFEFLEECLTDKIIDEGFPKYGKIGYNICKTVSHFEEDLPLDSMDRTFFPEWTLPPTIRRT
jgi:hypothetical protein